MTNWEGRGPLKVMIELHKREDNSPFLVDVDQISMIEQDGENAVVYLKQGEMVSVQEGYGTVVKVMVNAYKKNQEE